MIYCLDRLSVRFHWSFIDTRALQWKWHLDDPDTIFWKYIDQKKWDNWNICLVEQIYHHGIMNCCWGHWLKWVINILFTHTDILIHFSEIWNFSLHSSWSQLFNSTGIHPPLHQKFQYAVANRVKCLLNL